MLVCRLVPPSSIEAKGDTSLGVIIIDIVDLVDLDLKLVVIVVGRALGTTVQAQSPVHVLTMAE